MSKFIDQKWHVSRGCTPFVVEDKGDIWVAAEERIVSDDGTHLAEVRLSTYMDGLPRIKNTKDLAAVAKLMAMGPEFLSAVEALMATATKFEDGTMVASDAMLTLAALCVEARS